ncbi:MAG TPA: translation initiation factor IF-2 subunit alpha [Methanoregulaceae archaeon]|nr:MAG: translation initiation factor IF-2 subunit alpha [Methanolinea sp.]HON80980.1 translation initiation factor IF-2 subunit alpha [Methanoregulaceae archaeon]HPD09713.1 translation initiation factor IF-2 subunit alpha [Methanoregulaceae archaeon]HRT14566.1 translation initiation factor IF-2 subunit alpha [Methanoregulaceae archaeon]HRU30137.1 translation initiation factor IF-2 subunit alpha [Methanoregulaceae archaeon]
MSERSWPSAGELVVCTVRNIKDFAAFVSLDEYEGLEGLIPISEIATGWIKYIRDHIREGQKVVCKVLHVDRSRGHIDLSLKDVNDHQRREKIREWKNESKAAKWIGFAAEASGESPEVIKAALIKRYGDLYSVFEEIVSGGEDSLKKIDLSAKVIAALATVARENVKIPRVTVSGNLVLTTMKPDGVNIIRRALRSAEPKIADTEIELTYLGAPIYRIKVTAPDYKQAEKAIEKAANAAIGVVERAGGEGRFVKKPKSGKST